MCPKYTIQRNGLFFLTLFCTCLQAQSIIPLLGLNNRYGFADSLGNILVQPQFRDGWLPDNQGIAWALDTAQQFNMVRKDGRIVSTGLSQTSGMPSPPHLQFQHGLCVIHTAPGRFNILHERRGLLFDRDFAGCTILNPEYIVLENESGQMALADSSGSIRTGFNFIKISPTPREGYFYATQSDPSDPHSSWEWILMDGNGNSVLDSVFKNPTVAGSTWIIAEKNDEYGLIDWNQREILPFTFWSLEFIRDSLFLAEKSYPLTDQKTVNGRTENVRYTIIDMHNREYLPKSMGRLWFNSRGLPYFEASFEFDLKNKWIMDSSFQIIHRDSFNTIDQSYDGRFRVSWNGADGDVSRHGILDYTGRQIVPTEFRLIMELQQRSGYLVEKDGLWGFYAYSGQQVLPAKFAQIRHEVTDSTNLLWVNPHRDKVLFTAYDLNGKQLPMPDQNRPNPSIGKRTGDMHEILENGSRKFILPDGTKAEAPQDKWVHYKIYSSPHGSLLIALSDSRIASCMMPD
ncbi:MAG: WG repeat-containing protein [Lewinellaceae bacterium]|nr:WG repeat-containing protein [Lewinellaceae bacterium]